MKVRLSLLFVIALAGGLSVTASTANVQKHPAPPAVAALPYDEVEACPLPNGDAYPVEITPAGTGPLLSLPILVLLDGIPVPEAKRIVRDVNAMYGKMNIALTATYAPFPLKADGAAVDRQPTYGALAALKAVQKRYPRPPGDAALVHLLSAKDLLDDNNPQRDGTDRVAGIADCIGGVRLVGEQFSVSEGRYRFSRPNDPDDFHVIAMAHEVGHLFGAQHHYGNCSEGRTSTPGFAGSCTAMSQFAPVNAEIFGTFERQVIRGYADLVGTRR